MYMKKFKKFKKWKKYLYKKMYSSQEDKTLCGYSGGQREQTLQVLLL